MTTCFHTRLCPSFSGLTFTKCSSGGARHGNVLPSTSTRVSIGRHLSCGKAFAVAKCRAQDRGGSGQTRSRHMQSLAGGLTGLFDHNDNLRLGWAVDVEDLATPTVVDPTSQRWSTCNRERHYTRGKGTPVPPDPLACLLEISL